MSTVDLADLRITLLAGTLGQGGAERQLFHVVCALKESGAEVRLLCLTQGEFWQARIEDLGVPVTWVGENPSRFARLRRIIGELRAHRPAVIQSFHFYANFYASVAGRMCRIPDIGALRNDGLSEMRAYGRLLGCAGLRWPRVLAANSRVGIRNATTLGAKAERLFHLPNVLDTGHFCPGPARTNQSDSWNLVAVGRLHQQKRFDRLIQVMAQLGRLPGRPVRLVIVGDGPLRSELEALAVHCGVADAVQFIGAVEDTVPFLQAADAAVLTSDFEGTPNVVMEALSCGLPVVTTGAGGVREIMVDGETGTIVPLGPVEAEADGVAETETVSQLAQALQTLREDYEKRSLMGRQARAQAEDRFSRNRLPAVLSELYALALHLK